MKLKNLPTYLSILIIVFISLMFVYFIQTRDTQPPQVNRIEVIVPREKPIVRKPVKIRDPEFRQPPYREFRPSSFEPMGILTSPTQDTRALFGRANPAHRDRFNYYTTTLGNQSFPVPITYNGQDCMDRYLGCPEFYGNEQVTSFDNNQTYNVSMYDVNWQ